MKSNIKTLALLLAVIATGALSVAAFNSRKPENRGADSMSQLPVTPTGQTKQSVKEKTQGSTPTGQLPSIRQTGDIQSWETYTNTQYGFAFKHPRAWGSARETHSVNRNGVSASLLVSFKDSLSQSVLLVEYHLPPNGAELYKHTKAQFDSQPLDAASTKRYTTIAGSEALELTGINDGSDVEPPVKIVQVVFLDNQQTGAFNLRFSTPLTNADSEVSTFRQMLNTFKCID